MIDNFVITFTGAAQQITTARSAIREIHLQAESSNGNPFYVGGVKVSSTVGQRVPIPASSIPAPPYVIDGFEDGKVSADEWYVVGTSSEKVRVMLITYV